MKQADIVIIGGGIIGISIAYQLALRGATDVIVLERKTLASGSIGLAMGGIRQQFADELDIHFSLEGVRFYERFTGEDDPFRLTSTLPPRFLQYGYMFLCTTPESWQAMQRHAELQQSIGVPTQLLTAEEAKQRVPQLIVDDVLGATFCPTDGYSDPVGIIQALADEAHIRGVTISEYAPVEEIIVEHGRVQAVRTPQETISTPLVVNATGVYAPFIAQLVSIADLPIRPLRRQLLLTEPFADLPEDVPMTIDLVSGFHFRRRDGGVVFALPLPPEPEEARLNEALAPEAFALTTDDNFWPLLQEHARRCCPTLADARVARTWSGLYEMTPDEEPVLGKTEVEGFLCACGFSGHGFMHAPMAAKLITELVLDGASTTLDIEQFSIERFRTGKLIPTTRLI
ncbi:MAG TPA: FAD-binding oxidoreductase [Ktedonobacteraceae bacterium]